MLGTKAPEPPPKAENLKNQPDGRNPPVPPPQNKEDDAIKPNAENEVYKLDVTQSDEIVEAKKEDVVVNPANVVKLGNLDYIAK
ncbi:unnamed protein product, partial [Toxocara canis]|uniref:Surface anchored protein n=1 Tax=Toxocara canis TaxID=6265 RepID=A0A183VH97_TOXCA